MAAQPQQSSTALNPEQLHQINFSFVPSRLLATGVQLDVFSHIAAGKRTLEAITTAAKANPRGMRMFLDALVACQLLTKKNSRYGLTPLAAKFLVRQSADYAASMIEQDSLWESWRHLAKAVRTGKPVQRVESRKTAEKFFPMLVRTLHVINREPARRTARALGAGVTRKGLSVVDVGCGSGVWGISIAEADRQARITAQDFPGMLRLTRQYAKRHGVQDRFDYLPGDLKTVDFGKQRFDVALLGNIVHSEGERSSRRLFQRLHRALRPGGCIVIADMIPNEERTGPPFPVFFALTMLLSTEQGDTFSLGQYAQWLKKAGFDRVQTAEVGSHSPLIIGWKDQTRRF